MRVEDLKQLRQRLQDLPDELTPETESILAEFGLICREKYIPELLRTAGLHRETPEFEKDPCEFCFWMHQATKLGCVKCVDKSEYVDLFSAEASVKKEQLVKLLRDEV